MKKTALISDLIFTFFIVFLFTLCLFRYLQTSLWLACLLALLCGGLATCAVGALLQNKRKYFFLKKSDEAQKQKFFLHLALLPDNKKQDFFCDVFSTEDDKATPCGNMRICTEKEMYFLQFSLSPVTADRLLPAARLRTDKRKVLLCFRMEEEALELCRLVGINIKTGNEIYALVKKANAIPERFLGDDLPEKTKKRRLQLWFSKSNSRRFLTGGALILLTSLLTPFSYYYLVFGSLLLLVAVFVRIFGYE